MAVERRLPGYEHAEPAATRLLSRSQTLPVPQPGQRWPQLVRRGPWLQYAQGLVRDRPSRLHEWQPHCARPALRAALWRRQRGTARSGSLERGWLSFLDRHVIAHPERLTNVAADENHWVACCVRIVRRVCNCACS